MRRFVKKILTARGNPLEWIPCLDYPARNLLRNELARNQTRHSHHASALAISESVMRALRNS